jgi:hypothetical protein
MRKNLFIIGTLSLGAILTACSSSVSEGEGFLDGIKDQIEKADETNYETIKVNGQYSMGVPDFMTSSTSLNDDASLQYNNLYKEKYVIVIDEDKQEFIDVFKELGEYDDKKSVIDNYAEQQYKFMSDGSTIKYETKMNKMKVNGMNARGKNFDADVVGVPATVSYFFGFVEGEENLYMIMAWTLESKKDSFKVETQEMIKSLKEL